MAEPKEVSTSKPLMWQGLPFKGKAFTRKKTDAPPELDYDVYDKIFDLSNEDHIKEYEDICQRVVKGQVVVWVDDRKFLEKDGKFIVLLKWGEPFYRPPTDFEIHRSMMERMSYLPGDMKDGF